MKINKKLAIKTSIFITLVLGLTFIIPKINHWYDDCLKDHSKTLKAVGNLMKKNVLAFYKVHQRYPSLEESMSLMEKSGCLNVRQRGYSEKKNKNGKVYEKWASYECGYGSMRLGYGLSAGDLTVKHSRTNTEGQPFRYGFTRGNTRCSVKFNKNGAVSSYRGQMKCYQDYCFLRNWSA